MRPTFSSDPRSGSALLIVLGVIAVLAVLVAGFGRSLRADLRASGSSYEEARNSQLAQSALAAAQLEISKGAAMYADATGNVYFVTGDESYEAEIEALVQYRSGISLGRGMLAYRIVTKPYALDINGLSAAELGRLFEVSCGMEEGDERSALVDSILDWTDPDSNPRAYGAEEDFYQTLDRPRHCRNADFETVEELLLVNGMTPELLFGYGHPVRIEDGLLVGGGLYRFLIGDNCPEAQASVQYIRRGVFPDDDRRRNRAEEDTGTFKKLTVLPEVLYLIAEGFAPSSTEEDEQNFPGEAPAASGSTASVSRHMILVRLVLPENATSMKYAVDDFQENAAGELLERVLAYGIPEESDEL
jgi:hypothetical protein